MMIEGYHNCELPENAIEHEYYYGPAIETCFEDDMYRLFVENGEYSSQVNFCPVCGYKAKVEIE